MAMRHRWPTTPLRLAERFAELGVEATAFGAKGSAAKLDALADELRADPCRERILLVARDVGEALDVARDRLDAEPELRPVYLLWLRAHDVATHTRRLNAPGGFASRSPEDRLALSRQAVAAQPQAGTAAAAARGEAAMAARRARRTVATFTDDDRARALASHRAHGKERAP